jgi:hypothetical protein
MMTDANRQGWQAQRRLIVARAVLLMLVGLVLAGTQVTAVAAQMPADGLEPGEYIWTPELAQKGPLVIVISLPGQRAHVYRNGVRIGVSTVSTGKPGYDTPSGVYTILQKHREHRSNLYDDAPMPFMQRLTWDGVALHAGGLPGYPASHGCVRLPPAFAERLFAVTTPGTTVVIAASETFPPTVTSPGLFSPVDATTGAAIPPPIAPAPEFEWHPERSPDGPLTILLSTSDRQLVVLRNAVEIGHASIGVRDASIRGTRAFILLEGVLTEPSPVVPDRPALRWMALSVPGSQAPAPGLADAAASGRLSLPPEFARLLYDTLKPGAMAIVTDEPLQPAGSGITVLSSGSEGADR